MKKTALLLLGLLLGASLWAQNRITGTVSDSGGQPLIGAGVIVKGTTTGVVTDYDGRFEILAPQGAQLEFSQLGFKSQVVSIGTKAVIDVILEENSESLDEVVFVGYGVQKKKLLTGANIQVSGDKIAKLNTRDAFGALQTMAPGVNIVQSSGQPGEEYKVTIRGMGTTGSSTPLYVIDGVAGGSLKDLNPSDIESIDILKDAASCAIYGARAANGVILVTTKQARNSDQYRVNVSYDGYYGFQNLNTNGVKPLNATQYMDIIDQALESSGSPGKEWEKLMPKQYELIKSGKWNGTNWLNESKVKNAAIQNHAINLSIGTKRSVYSMGLSYYGEDGTVGYPAAPQYKRITARINSSHVLLEVGGRSIIKFGENIVYSNRSKTGIHIGDTYNSDMRNLLTTPPVLPARNDEGGWYILKDMDADGWEFDNSISNPLASMEYSSKYKESKQNRIQGNAYLEIKPIKDLTLRSNVGVNFQQNASRSYKPAYDLSSSKSNLTDDVSQSQNYQAKWTLENTINYVKTFGEHSIDVLVGQSVEKWGYGNSVSAKNSNSIFPDSFKHAFIDNTQDITTMDTEVGGAPHTRGALSSFFGRINYNWKEKYMASVIMRADGSSNFARGHRWGYFPSVSAGWVMTNEPWMAGITKTMNFFKLRGSWGQNGNADISKFQYLATIAFSDTSKYYFDNKDSGAVGAYPDILPNKEVSWEKSEQLDFGFDARLFNDRLAVNFDWYKKTTKDWLVRAPQLDSYGTGAPYINGGDVENRGVELAITWSDFRRKFGYSVGINLAHNRNEVTRIANESKIIHGPSTVLAQNTYEVFRAQEGYPIGYFWGYKTAGVFQNQSQIDEWKAAGKAILQKSPQPGDLMFIDRNGDGEFSDDDKTMIGNPNPKINMGVNISLSYAGFDLSINGYGAFGQDVMRCYRHFSDKPDNNYTTDVFTKYWSGEGTTNKFPRFSHGKDDNFSQISDMYVEDASFFKISNITLGYDFAKLLRAKFAKSLRFYVAAKNCITITKYKGMDPEVGYGGETNWASGIDNGYYPGSRAIMLGLSLKF